MRRDKGRPQMASALFPSSLSRSVCKHKSFPLPLATLGLHLLDHVLCLQVAPPGPTIFTGPQMLLLNMPSCRFTHLQHQPYEALSLRCCREPEWEGRGWDTVPTDSLWVQHCSLLLQQQHVSVRVFRRGFPEHHQCAFAIPSDGFTSHPHLLPQHPPPLQCPADVR